VLSLIAFELDLVVVAGMLDLLFVFLVIVLSSLNQLFSDERLFVLESLDHVASAIQCQVVLVREEGTRLLARR